ncbi:MAG TPA: ATP-binding protein, partial [Ktedonobacterales bacterium]|nr:ATP-binding protein [Ktedonobacterales bacterium]
MEKARKRLVARIESRVRRAVEDHALWPPGAIILAAVSGGPDSLALLGTLLALRERRDPQAPGEIVVAHLDHGLRGEASAADAAFVAAFAAER